MDYIENVSIEPIDNSKAVWIGVLIIIFNIFLRYTLPTDLALIPLGVSLLWLLITIVIRFFVASYVLKIAKKLNRNPIFWAVFSFLLPPPSLIIIGFLDTKFTDEALKTATEECRSEYRTEKVRAMNLPNSGPEMEKRQLSELKDRYNLILNKKLKYLLAEIQVKEISNPIYAGNIKYVVDYEEHEGMNDKIVGNSRESFSGDPGKCPACGYKIDPRIIICPDCGITLNK